MHTSGTDTRRKFIITCILAVVILVPSLWGFGTKFIEFIALFRSSSEGAFAISPIMNYLLAGFGFFCLLCWGIAQGMFTDVEQPKYTMLQTEQRLDNPLMNKTPAANDADHPTT